MKRKLLLALAGLGLCSTGAMADDVFKDVTSQYLKNAGFEGSYESIKKPSSDRDIYQPEEWTVNYTNGNGWDMTCLNSSCTQWSQFSGKAQLDGGG